MTKQTDNPHSYSSTHVELPKEMADRIRAVGATIPPEDLAEDGCEDCPHVTVKYGLNSDSPAAVKDALKGEMPVRFRLGHTKVFPATADRQSDVLVAGVHSEDLHRLHHLVSGSAPHLDTHAGYTPHATIAYLKPGKGEKYAGRSDLAGMEGVVDEVVHSNKAGEETRIPLAGKVRVNRMALDAARSAIILDASPLDTAKELPLVLTGQPGFEEIPSDEEIGKNADGSPVFKTRRVPIQYYKKEIARVGNWNNRGLSLSSGVPAPFSLTADHFDQVVRNFKERQKAGIRPFLPDTHVERRDAAANNGEVIDVERKGDKLFGTLKVVGSGSMEKLLKNDVSVYLVDGSEDLVTDAAGKKYSGYVLHHVALTPNSALPHLGPFQRIAASADAPARDVPVYDFAGLSTTAAPRRKGSRMTPEIATKARATLSLSADAVPDDKLDDAVAEKALALSADLATRTTERDTAIRERDAAKADAEAKGRDVLALSANDPSKLDPIIVSMVADNIASRRDLAVRNGAVSEAEAKGLDAILLEADGMPNRIALSASGTGKERRPHGAKMWDWVLRLGANGIRTGTARPGDVTPAERIALDASGAANPDLQKQMIALANGSGGPIGGVAKMTRDEK